MSSIVASYAPATWSRWPHPLTGARYTSYFAPAFRAGVVTRAYFANAQLAAEPTGAFVPFVIGKPSHAADLHPGSRISERYGHTLWHCPAPCGAEFSRLRDAKRHVARTVATSYHKELCPITVAQVAAAATAKITQRLSVMTTDQLEAHIARLRG